VLAVGLALLAPFPIRSSLLGQSRETLCWRYGLDLMASCPRNSVLFAEEDRDYFTLHYFHDIEGMRTDLTAVTTFLWQEPWGVAASALKHPEWRLDPMPQNAPWDRLLVNVRKTIAYNLDRRPVLLSYSPRFIVRVALGKDSPWGAANCGLAARIARKGSPRPPVSPELRKRLADGAAWGFPGEIFPTQRALRQVYDIAYGDAVESRASRNNP
jgi:hypothetical protein